MHFDFSETDKTLRYKLMTASITPRPIAWVTSCNAKGERNAAPFSFFNMMSATPPLVVLGIMRKGPSEFFKDSAANILETGEFVVNLVTEADAMAANQTSYEHPAGVDELAVEGIATTPSLSVKPPRITSAPVSMECVLEHSHVVGRCCVILGEVKHFHIADAFLDTGTMHVDTPGMNVVGRMHGADWYVRCSDLFALPRPTPPE
jgi:flavin reductase (DIM6/NTAB) family NADH-FMN oxidoreductase RutF